AQVLQVDVAELDADVVALEAEVALLAQQAGMPFELVLVVVEVGIDEDGAVLLDEHLAALADDADAVPLADGVVLLQLRRLDVVDGAGVLIGGELGLVDLVPVFVVDELDLHADVGGVALVGGADADAAVAAPLRPAVLAAQLEVAELLLGEQVTAPAALAD